MKRVVFILFLLLTLCSNSFAQNTTSLGGSMATKAATSGGGGATSNPDYCDPSYRKAIVENIKVLTESDVQDVNRDIKPPQSLIPPADKKDDPCFSIPSIAIVGGFGGGSGGSMMDNLIDKLTSKLNDKCKEFLDKLTNKLDFDLGDKLSKEIDGFTTIKYKGRSYNSLNSISSNILSGGN